MFIITWNGLPSYLYVINYERGTYYIGVGSQKGTEAIKVGTEYEFGLDSKFIFVGEVKEGN